MSATGVYRFSSLFWFTACSTSLPSGNLVDGLPLVEHNGAGKVGVNKEANIFMASGPFKHDVLRIHLSDLDAGLE